MFTANTGKYAIHESYGVGSGKWHSCIRFVSLTFWEGHNFLHTQPHGNLRASSQCHVLLRDYEGVMIKLVQGGPKNTSYT